MRVHEENERRREKQKVSASAQERQQKVSGRSRTMMTLGKWGEMVESPVESPPLKFT
jgi:hypothetical protein